MLVVRVLIVELVLAETCARGARTAGVAIAAGKRRVALIRPLLTVRRRQGVLPQTLRVIAPIRIGDRTLTPAAHSPYPPFLMREGALDLVLGKTSPDPRGTAGLTDGDPVDYG